ncbi:MAG: DUF6265 family protein [Candidatus Acidiferrales bacterium]
MTRTAVAARALRVVLVILAVLGTFAMLPSRALAQEPAGAGTTPPPLQPQALVSQPSKTHPSIVQPKPSAPSAPPASKETLAQLAWLAGHWQGNWGPRTAQQVWMPPKAGVMVGVFQLTENTKTLVVELYTILATPQGIELRVRHFTPSLTAWKSAPSVFKLMTFDSKSFLFVNQGNGHTKHWLMKRTGPDAFVARFEIVPEKGEVQSPEITYRRQRNSTPANH